MLFQTQTSEPVTYNNGLRRHPRTLFSVPITVDHVSGNEMRSTHGISLDISKGGMGALVQTSLLVGETVSVHVPLSSHDLTAVAVVRHSSKQRLGLEFMGITPDQWSQLTMASTSQLPAEW